MSGSDTDLELHGSAEARGRGVEHVAVVAEGCVVGVLDHCHDLDLLLMRGDEEDAVVTVSDDARQNHGEKGGVGRDLRFFPGEADMALVDTMCEVAEENPPQAGAIEDEG